MERISEANNIKEAIEFMCEEYGMTKLEVLETFSENDILHMMDTENVSENQIKLDVIKDDNNISYSSMQEINLVISCILTASNHNQDFIKYYSMISGDVFYIGRKVTFQGKRYTVFFSVGEKIYITDGNCNLCVTKEDINIIVEDFNNVEIINLFKLSHSFLNNKTKFSMCRFVEIFANMFDLNLTKFMKLAGDEINHIVIKELKKYSGNSNYNFGNVM